VARTQGALILALLLPAPGFPQAATASLEIGIEGDDSPGRTVHLSGSGLERDQVTRAPGRAVFFNLRPGLYRVSVALPLCTAAREVRIEAGQDILAAVSCEDGERAPEAVRRRSLDRGTSVSAEELRTVPRPSDPWSVLRDIPGIVTDRVNVGGSDTAQQSLILSRGDPGPGAVWTLDGVDITDPAALGFTSLYPDMDALAEMQVRTGAVDVRVRTPGAQVGLFLREPGEALAGAVHLRGTGDPLQSDNTPPALRARNFLQNRTEEVLEMGAEAGGPLSEGRLWLWGAVFWNSLRQQTFTEHAETLRVGSVSTKARLRLGEGALSLLALRSEKTDEDRDTGFDAAPAARWKQSGPATLVALEDQRSLGGLSLLSRASYMAASIRLDPQGGTAANAYEDLQGVAQGSYYTLRTDRPRFQAGIEASTRYPLFGRDHDLLLGLGYQRTPVTTVEAWPGNRVLGLERQSVFFRTFHLTGFAQPIRDLSASSVQDQIDAYFQDTVSWGRFTLTLGARLDRLAGHNRPSAVAANPVFPELLPAVDYPGGESRFRWLDLLPRAGLAWEVDSRGTLMARMSYSAYAAALGTTDVLFDNPIGRQFGVLSYYWIDRNGDNVVQRGELDAVHGLLGAAGLNPQDPASTRSPNRIDPHLRSPRTHEVAASLEKLFGPALQLGAHVAFRRLLRPLWQPLLGLTLADYIVRGGVSGQLLGQPYNVAFFAPASESQIVPGSGRLLTNREGYSQDTITLEVTAGGRVGGHLEWKAWGSFVDWRERFPDRNLAVQDPTPLDTGPQQDLGVLAVQPGGLGREDVFVNARWTAGATLHGHLPGRVEATARVWARDGFPIPYFQVGNTGDPTGGAKNVLIAPQLDSYRLPSLALVDARIARGVRVGRGTLTASVDAFNLLNSAPVLQVVRDIELPNFNRPREIARPRIIRFGLEYRF
jgi:hypothetical protein